MKLIKVELLPNAGNVKAKVHVETGEGKTACFKLIKQTGYRAYIDPQGATITHKQKRNLQREAINAWQNLLGDTFEGLLESEKVFRGSRFKSLGVQLKRHCITCDKTTPSEITEQDNRRIRNACYFCGTLRKGNPYLSRKDFERIQDKRNACQGIEVCCGSGK